LLIEEPVTQIEGKKRIFLVIVPTNGTQYRPLKVYTETNVLPTVKGLKLGKTTPPLI